jgi:hypothetical protein
MLPARFTSIISGIYLGDILLGAEFTPGFSFKPRRPGDACVP